MLELVLAVMVTVCLIPGLLLRYAPLASEVTQRQKRILLLSYGAALSVNAAAVYFLFRMWGICIAVPRNMGVLFAVATTIMHILVIRNRVREHLFLFGSVITCDYLLLAIPAFISNQALEVYGFQSPFLFLAVYAAALIASFFPMRKLLRNTVEPFLCMDSGDCWRTIWFAPIAMFGAMFVLFPGNGGQESLRLLVSSGFNAAVLILLCQKISADHKRMLEEQITTEHLEKQKLYFAELRAKVEETRKNTHDFKHYANVINHYLVTDDTEGLRACCVELNQQLSLAASITGTDSCVAVGVIHRYTQQAAQEKMAFKVKGSLDIDWVADIDICVILGNLLDNAMEGCRTIQEDRKIVLSMEHNRDTLCILVQNTYDGIVRWDHDQLLSRKRESSSGVGLESVKSICRKYHGYMETCMDGQLFSVNVLLNRPNTETEKPA